MSATCLSIHAQYQCRHSGACCRTWAVPAEPHVIRIVEQRRLQPFEPSEPLFVPSRKSDPHGEFVIAKDQNGRCVFFEQDAHRRHGTAGSCVIHREAGVGALPTACRHFPRIFLRDCRGTFVGLSHFCPTAAGLLLDAPALATVDAGPPLMIDEPIEGLDARDALPPLLRPDLLCDPDGYDAWERASIATFDRPDLSWQAAVAWIASATERARTWRPGHETLAECMTRAFAEDPQPVTRALSDEQLMRIVWQSGDERVPLEGRPPRGFEDLWLRQAADGFAQFDRPMKNFLAARLFGNWIAYQGRGLRSVVDWIRAAGALVRHHALIRALDSGRSITTEDFLEAIRMTDLVLLHAIDTQAFARVVATVEYASS